MVCVESLACGTPVVGFEAGGPESVFAGDFVKFVENGDVEALEKAVKDMLEERPNVDTAFIRRRFAAARMAEKYRNCYYNVSKK